MFSILQKHFAYVEFLSLITLNTYLQVNAMVLIINIIIALQ